MADGKVSFAYSRFLGLDKDKETGKIVVVPEQAETVRLIFKLFLEGMTPHSIAAELTERGIKTPSGKDVWNQQTVRRMLSNEKYKGDALLQKEFTVDFLQKKMKKNEGEVPQYYVEGNHEAIISPAVFDMVQQEMERTFSYWKHCSRLLDALEKSGLSGVLIERAINHSILESSIPVRILPNDNRQMRERVTGFAVCGLMAMVVHWHHGGYVESAEQMAQIAMRLVTKPLFTEIPRNP